MRSWDLRIEVASATGLPGPLATAVTVHLPDRMTGPVTVLFGLPGGSYGRRYYDMAGPEARGIASYSEALHHTDAGFAFVACDHLGVGESSMPDPFALSYENLAAANDATARTVVAGLIDGTLIAGLDPLAVDRAVGLGQSMGGALLVVQQGIHHTFDRIVLLGWSSIAISLPTPDGERTVYPVPPRGSGRDALLAATSEFHPHVEIHRYAFYWEDADRAMTDADLASFVPFTDVVRGDATTPWGSATVPPCALTMFSPGAVAAEAAEIRCPVLVACGARDLVGDPESEPSAYRKAARIEVIKIERMGHMHNFATSRAELWRQIDRFAAEIR